MSRREFTRVEIECDSCGEKYTREYPNYEWVYNGKHAEFPPVFVCPEGWTRKDCYILVHGGKQTWAKSAQDFCPRCSRERPVRTRIRNFLKFLKLAGFSLVILFLVYLGIAIRIFEFRHPKANRYAWMWHISEVISFRSAEELR